jgi:hypothetical protein
MISGKTRCFSLFVDMNIFDSLHGRSGTTGFD